jgi:ferritin-like metal-binding protein YciE
MKFFSANIESLRELYDNQIRSLLSTEQQITEALPKMIEKATDPELKQAFQTHLKETLSERGGKVDSIKCKSTAALISGAEDLVKDAKDESVRDAVLIAGAQRIEHFEIASYGTVRNWARILGENRQAQLLDQTVKEEGNADHILTSIANRVNPYAEKAA